MEETKKGKLFVEFGEGVYPNKIELPRKYTLTHSDETGDLYLVVGKDYDYSKINETRDEVLGNWIKENDEYILICEVLLDNDKGVSGTIIRDTIFRRELPLAIGAIIRGDKDAINTVDGCLNAKIMIKFKSKVAEYNVVEQWGVVSDYLSKMRSEFNESFPLQPIGSNFAKPYPPNTNVILPPTPKNIWRNISEALVTMLGSYIRTEVELSFGRRTPYCLINTNILDVRQVNNYGPCSREYEVTVGVRAGRNPPPYNNLIITFLINENRVTVKSTKNPRE